MPKALKKIFFYFFELNLFSLLLFNEQAPKHYDAILVHFPSCFSISNACCPQSEVPLSLRRVTCVSIRDSEGPLLQGNKWPWSFPGIALRKFSLGGSQPLPTQAGFRHSRAPDSQVGHSFNTLETKLLRVSDWPIQGELFGVYKLDNVTLHPYNHFYLHQFHFQNRNNLNSLFQIFMITIVEGNC